MHATDKSAFTVEQAQRFARASLMHYHIYDTLSSHEHDEHLRDLMTELARITKDEFAFWGRKGMVRGDEARHSIFPFGYVILRKFLGVTMTTHLIINRERARLSNFEAYCADCLDLDERKAVEAMILRLPD